MRRIKMNDILEIQERINEIMANANYISDSLDTIKDLFTVKDTEELALNLDNIQKYCCALENCFSEVPLFIYPRGQEKVIEENDSKEERIIKHIKKEFSDPDVKEWYINHLRDVYNPQKNRFEQDQFIKELNEKFNTAVEINKDLEDE